ncbi:hypothetical protein ACR8AL_07465 [Clavibacter sepedonicus]|uniref:Uncharacterized protein n=1 Tax=Clavibacter sepedonicus TaxID=31964 RepID=B0RJF4_CLASE|nr:MULTISPECIES: hypothetical protein [Clavibacter]MBD5382467.1 hypothetical protein [Clavibacter sp.]OQJ45286.1 hypothetical protein B5P19_15610 [Clavibacter sepedonicus]OQJ50973.1 hypothetical protein B5P20_16245 [Clavibacter sepedonicus]UUK67219.1 hypothetical protein LRE50_15790 [Clavibacter sepedonicus]CAQ03344.1 hypothetical protein pCSL0101 [Clavibacter sepedonicus]
MTADLENLREELRKMAAEIDRLHELRTQRFHLADRAHEAGLTWNEIAILLNMTQNGLIAAQTNMRAKLAAGDTAGTDGIDPSAAPAPQA